MASLYVPDVMQLSLFLICIIFCGALCGLVFFRMQINVMRVETIGTDHSAFLAVQPMM